MRRLLLLIVSVLAALVSVRAQAPFPGGAKPLAFEVASIKPNRTSDPATGNFGNPGGHVLLIKHTVRMLLGSAFSMDLNHAGRQFIGLPSWADSDPYDIEAPGLSFTEALREQLGLKLDPQTVPVDVIVIDHIEKPIGD